MFVLQNPTGRHELQWFNLDRIGMFSALWGGSVGRVSFRELHSRHHNMGSEATIVEYSSMVCGPSA